MKRRRHILFNLVTALSLLLAMALSASWWRSHRVAETVTMLQHPTVLEGDDFRTAAQSGLWLFTARGCVQVRYGVTGAEGVIRPGYEREPLDSIPSDVWRLAVGGSFPLGKRFGRFGIYREAFGQGVQAPHWFLVSLASLIPAVRALPKLHRRTRGKPGCCTTCGYDLRATPDSCPECGASAPPPAPTPP